ncbi:uncharacterized protein FOMMEDRAFT_158185 [Fomitiporia mediterranea MF3/22]|uniref:uncharacterized protein n=1 Tax=Fomitiporia mediterranea (strain MF3/22) TaxID=694068 RepID=UPI0004408036|nr:uncharacterized protein FOMMEDRAFT_158185 [Fomitiporia mediterranea MF3/22]EJD01052.1 hypothetical protein FOMMEDRAFT_158185 [Fomitiporia mediterranea MF3/22]
MRSRWLGELIGSGRLDARQHEGHFDSKVLHSDAKRGRTKMRKSNAHLWGLLSLGSVRPSVGSDDGVDYLDRDSPRGTRAQCHTCAELICKSSVRSASWVLSQPESLSSDLGPKSSEWDGPLFMRPSKVAVAPGVTASLISLFPPAQGNLVWGRSDLISPSFGGWRRWCVHSESVSTHPAIIDKTRTIHFAVGRRKSMQNIVI